MPIIRCIRCLKPIPGIPVIVGDSYFGKGCYDIYYRRMKLRATLGGKCKFFEGSCAECQKLKAVKCPLEEDNNNFKIGRKR